jgi:protocatechuate 3,4-dioxygenase beta subunit
MTNRKHDDDNHDRGLQFDVQTLMHRRRALMLLGGAGALLLVGCGAEEKTGALATSTSTNSAAGTATTAGTLAPSATATNAAATGTATALVSPIPTGDTPASACVAGIPEETGGPYPADGTNGPNVLTQSGIVRQDIRSSFGTSTTMAQGIPLTIALTIVDTSKSCAPMGGAAVYAWHCDRDGNYSMYSQAALEENYLRGVQVADADGRISFTSIFPACYSGRWPHVHFEVYPSLDAATSSANKLATSQLALPKDVCDLVYATSGYEQSVRNLSQVSLDQDMVFSDGYALQMAAMAGDVDSGYTASLTVGV